MTFACALILASIGLKAQITTGKDVAVVAADAGKVRAYVHSGIYTYKGIPYVEAARLKAPHKPKPWAGVRSFLSYGPVSPLISAHFADRTANIGLRLFE